VGEFCIQRGWQVFSEPFRKGPNPILAAIGLTLLGALAGLLTSLIVPNRIFGQYGIKGVSILFSPLLTGLIMHRYGQWLVERGRPRSPFATFWGGALFALGMAFVRYSLVGAQ
jgi:hypothetical protein